MNTAGNPPHLAPFLPADNRSLWTRLGQVLDRVFVSASRTHATPSAATPLADRGPISKLTAISSQDLPPAVEARARAPAPAAPRRPGLPARWKESHRVVINSLN